MKLANGYSEIKADALGHDCVDAVWTNFSESEKHHFILPDGRIDIIITFIVSSDGIPIDTTLLVATPFTLPRYITIHPRQGFLGVRLKPGVAWGFGLTSLPNIYGGVLQGKNVEPFLRNSYAFNLNCSDINSLLLELNKYVFEAKISFKSSLALDAIKIIDESKGCITVTKAAKQIGSCERTFRRFFLQSVGLSPKAYASTVRLHNALNLLSGNSQQMVAVASECGYSDQAHMIREFKQFTGQRPTAFKGKKQESLLAHL